MHLSRTAALAVAVALVTCGACKGKEEPTKEGSGTAQIEAPPYLRDSVGPIPIERVAKLPMPGTTIPGSLAFTRDDTTITYLYSADNSLSRELYAFDIASGAHRRVISADLGGNTEVTLSLEEKLERERRRERGVGVTRYQWSKEGNVLLVPMRGDLRVQDGLEGEPRTLPKKDSAPILSPHLSRDGTQVAFVRDDELYVMATDGKSEARQLTSGARGTGKTHGLAEYVAQEEMGRRSGFWWSRDDNSIAFTEVDETHIPKYRIVHQGSEQTGSTAQEDHGYPFAGMPNARVKLGVVPVSGGTTTWMDLGPEHDIYLARVHWMPNGELWAEVENRQQTRLDLIRLDPKTGRRSVVLTEESDVWINLHSHFRPLVETADAHFVWASERTGYMHLYLYDERGNEVRALTSGEWPVDHIAGVDEKGRRVFFVSGKGDPTQKQLYVVSFDGGEPRRVTKEPGSHGIVLSHDFSRFIDIHSSLESEPRIHVRSTEDASIVTSLFDEKDPEVVSLGLTPPELVTLEADDGTQLHGAVYVPPAPFRAPYPTMISVYGGPHAQRVSDSWGMTSDLSAQHLRHQGVLVLKLDNRGSARRGLAFEGAIKNDLGNIEVADQVRGVEWLVAKGWTDAERVGISGWSYGGYLAAMALARAPETFGVAIAGAPVTHWDGYDTHYTERYMGTPHSNPTGYQESSVMHHVDGIEGHLLLVHGLIDENVHFRHTARLINALIKAQKNYDLLLFPNERHSPRSEADRVYMQKRIYEYIREHL